MWAGLRGEPVTKTYRRRKPPQKLPVPLAPEVKFVLDEEKAQAARDKLVVWAREQADTSANLVSFHGDNPLPEVIRVNNFHANAKEVYPKFHAEFVCNRARVHVNLSWTVVLSGSAYPVEIMADIGGTLSTLSTADARLFEATLRAALYFAEEAEKRMKVYLTDHCLQRSEILPVRTSES